MLRCKTDAQTLLEVLEFRNRLEIECFLPLKQWAKCGIDFWQALSERMWLACAVCMMGFERLKKRPVNGLQAALGNALWLMGFKLVSVSQPRLSHLRRNRCALCHSFQCDAL